LYYLPPYLPDFNPIEEAFSFIKAYLRRHASTFRHAVDSKDRSAILLFMHTALGLSGLDEACGVLVDSVCVFFYYLLTCVPCCCYILLYVLIVLVILKIL
ncbi:hypothetical protein K439DRAFT_1373174, partial [Ramaria rubella]